MSIPARQATDAQSPRPRTSVLPLPLTRGGAPVYAALALAFVIRATHVLIADFPLNDGGLFYAMTRELQAAHYRLPAFTSYNGAGIPFAYPPLAFYVTAAVNSATGIPLVQLFRFLPLLAAWLLVVAFYQLAKAMLPDRATVAAAVLAFAVVPRSYVWLIMGGGLTRSFGLLAAVVALHQAYRLYTRREWRFAATTAVACALTVLSHIGTAPFLAASIALLFLFYGRHLHGLLSSVVVAAATVALTAPWWATVIGQHGLTPFLAAQTTSGSAWNDFETLLAVVLRLLRFNMGTTGEPLFPVFGFFALLGAFASLRPGRFVLVVWWALTIFIDARAGETYATIPGALLAGIGIAVVFVPVLRTLYATPAATGGALPAGAAPRGRTAALLRFVPAGVCGALLLYAIAGSLTHSPNLGGGMGLTLNALTPEERALMARLDRETPHESRFVVVTGQPWFSDRVAEWFPVLANRVSVNTVQGSEWVPGGFAREVRQNIGIQGACANAGGACLADWARSTGRAFTHVYVAKQPRDQCCRALMDALRTDPAYAVVYDGPAALVAERRVGVAAR